MGVYTGSGPTDPVVGNKVSVTNFGVPTGDAVQALTSAFTAFTPSWIASTTNPTIGNGTLTGFYTQVGKFVVFRIRLTTGSTTTYGTGRWAFYLPTSYVGVFPGASETVASVQIFDTSTSSRYVRTGYMANSTDMAMVDDAGVAVGPTTPFTWATGDTLSVTGWYEAG